MLSFVALGATPSLGQVVYDSTVNPLPGNLPSVGGEAYAFSEVGDAVTFAGTARSPKDVTVTLSSWGCESGNWYTATCVTTPGATFNVDITFNIYSAGSPNPGALLATRTQTFAVPYRPSSDNINCTGGRWKDAVSGNCYNGLANNITFDFSAQNVVLPNSVVYGVVYNTTHYGPQPVGESAACFTSSGGCGYDSMNVALAPTVVVGSKPFPDTLYWDTIYAGNYCDLGAAGVGTFRLDSPTSACWGGFIPAAQFTAYTIATTAAGCKNNGWQSLSRAGGSPFKNQGDCIQYVNTNK
jgi:hypothetical protein